MARPDQIVILLPKGTSLRVDLADADGQFIISYGDPEYCPANGDYRAVRVMADLPDSTGREGIVYEEFYGAEITAPEATIVQPQAVTMVVNSQPLAPPSLDQLLSNAVARDETGRVPTEPVGEAVTLFEQAQARAAGAAPGAANDSLEEPSEGTPTPVASAATLPPDAKPMEDGAPRDGEWVVLYYDEPMIGLQSQVGRWSSAFGRQFWVDVDDDSLGFDDAFIGWRKPTQTEKEEYDIHE